MDPKLEHQLSLLPQQGVAELRIRYAALFGESTNASNKTWLIKRIAWRLQALAEGDLSERARRRAAELARDADLRLNPPSNKRDADAVTIQPSVGNDNRLPPPGSVLTRSYKGQVLQVKVLEHGFEYGGKTHLSLTAVAKEITGTHCNGFHFFRLAKGGRS